ncbi:PilZ domain-containing protein [bacterium]|nr:PilZ domain-containing protein [bacterium]
MSFESEPNEETTAAVEAVVGQDQSVEGEERRQSYRLNKVLGAEIEYEEMSIQARLFVIDISVTGFRATNQFPLPTSCDLKVRIILQAGSPPLETQARIVWSKELPMSGLFQFGFEFQALPEAQRTQLEAFIEHERVLAHKPAQTVDLGRPWTTIRN